MKINLENNVNVKFKKKLRSSVVYYIIILHYIIHAEISKNSDIDYYCLLLVFGMYISTTFFSSVHTPLHIVLYLFMFTSHSWLMCSRRGRVEDVPTQSWDFFWLEKWHGNEDCFKHRTNAVDCLTHIIQRDEPTNLTVWDCMSIICTV